MIVVQHTQQQQQQQQKKIVYYQKTEIFKNFLYFLKIEIIVHLIEKANIFLYSLKTDVGMGEGIRGLLAPLHKIYHTNPTMMKLGTVIPYRRKIQKMYKLRDTSLEFC